MSKLINTRNRKIAFKIQVKNLTDGHNAPTSLDPIRQVWLHVVVKDAKGRVVMESGDPDPEGNLRDILSPSVKKGDVPLDRQLFNLQSHFVTRT